MAKKKAVPGKVRETTRKLRHGPDGGPKPRRKVAFASEEAGALAFGMDPAALLAREPSSVHGYTTDDVKAALSPTEGA